MGRRQRDRWKTGGGADKHASTQSLLSGTKWPLCPPSWFPSPPFLPCPLARPLTSNQRGCGQRWEKREREIEREREGGVGGLKEETPDAYHPLFFCSVFRPSIHSQFHKTSLLDSFFPLPSLPPLLYHSVLFFTFLLYSFC
ncbi:unnamed protein product [Pleuronectes platessa]|uniref:Uncharacterized protein n=1 Tax=Pleuronectes platessa TaxID=8262 RepID=A0A9N7UQM1_PLEPL|nr:unnamed protein product [Pleuronectes platessa]